jgi:pyruvate-formate lyase-activating enzyme
MAKKTRNRGVHTGTSNFPHLLVADDRGTIYEHPLLEMAGASGLTPCSVSEDELTVLPPMSKLFYLPGCTPIGRDPSSGRFLRVEEMSTDGREFRCHAVSAFLEPGYVRLYLPAADYTGRESPLPLWAYAAVGCLDGRYCVPAFSVQYDYRWDPQNFDDAVLIPRVKEFRRRYPENRLVTHLERCACGYHCFAAKNFFLRRWEMPLPVSRGCNAECLGCISLQPPGGFPASHERISFAPSVEEIVEITVPHLEKARDPVASFGQGCEGEPLTEFDLIAESIREIRSRTRRGVINLNSNGSYPGRVEHLCRTGLDSIRISLSSAREDLYNNYFLPGDYTFDEVIQSVKIARSLGVYTMINYLVFPGINDQLQEIEAMKSLIRKTGVQYIHLKNLNIDPWYYIEKVNSPSDSGIGIGKMMEELRRACPAIQFGYFNPSRALPDRQ